jgi:hypothetical protein
VLRVKTGGSDFGPPDKEHLLAYGQAVSARDVRGSVRWLWPSAKRPRGSDDDDCPGPQVEPPETRTRRRRVSEQPEGTLTAGEQVPLHPTSYMLRSQRSRSGAD